MLEHMLSKARKILHEAQLKLPVDMAASIKHLYRDIETLINFVNKEIGIIEQTLDLDEGTKRIARRELFENASRKFEVIKANRTNPTLDKELETKLLNASFPGKDENSLLKFLREREIRDRLFGMTEAQILSNFGDSLFDGSNLLLLDAILNAPPGFEMLPKSTLKKMRWIRAIKLNPEVASELEMAREMTSMTRKILTLVKIELDLSRKKELPLSFTNKHIPD